MIPYWKLKRELSRLAVQAKGLPQAFYEPVQQRRHDQWRAGGMDHEAGDVAFTGKAALVLIFQPKGIPASLLQTLDHLIANGFAPLVISNTPLTETDRAALKPRLWTLACRPNFGYDFGGYRDGLWLLDHLGIRPERLLVLNDSVWFPVMPECDLLAQMEATGADFVGTQVFGRVGEARSKRKWSQPFYGSYCFMLGRAALEHAAFQAYWRNYRLTSNKEKTLHRGERAFSYMMFATGLPHAGIYSRDRFEAVVNGLAPAELEEALHFCVCLTEELEARRVEILDRAQGRSNDAWQNEARALLHDSAESKNYIGSNPVVSLKYLKFPMIKKNNEMLYQQARRRILTAHSEGRLPNLDATVLPEIEARVAAQPY